MNIKKNHTPMVNPYPPGTPMKPVCPSKNASSCLIFGENYQLKLTSLNLKYDISHISANMSICWQTYRYSISLSLSPHFYLIRYIQILYIDEFAAVKLSITVYIDTLSLTIYLYLSSALSLSYSLSLSA